MLIIYTFIVFFVAESPLHLRSPPAETHDRNGTEVTGDSESSVRGGSMSDLKAHGMLVFVRGVAGLGMGYLMGLPMKRLMDGLQAMVVLDRVEKGKKVLEEAETIHGAEEHGVEQEGGREMTELKGGDKGSNTDDPSGRGESRGCSSCKGDEVVIDIDPVDAAQEKDGLLKRGRPTGRYSGCHGRCGHQLDKQGEVTTSKQESNTAVIIWVVLGRVLLIVEMAALAIWWE